MVRLHDVFAQGLGFVLVFEYMISDLSEMIHNIDLPLMEDQVKSYMEMLLRGKNWYFVTKIVLTTVRKNCSSDREKLLKFEAEGREFAKILRLLEQFIQTVKGQNNFW